MQPKSNLIDLDKNNHDHLATMYAIRTHAEVAKYLRGSPPSNFNDHVNYLQHVGSHKRFFLVQVESVLTGYCQLTIGDHSVEIGMALHPDFCNKGIGSLALSLLLSRMQHDSTNQSKPVILYVKKDNSRAIRLYNKFGFLPVGDENEFGEYLMQKNF